MNWIKLNSFHVYADYNLCISKPALLLHAKTQGPGIIVYSPIEYNLSWMSLYTSLTIWNKAKKPTARE